MPTRQLQTNHNQDHERAHTMNNTSIAPTQLAINLTPAMADLLSPSLCAASPPSRRTASS
jgi:hypothetical protein